MSFPQHHACPGGRVIGLHMVAAHQLSPMSRRNLAADAAFPTLQPPTTAFPRIPSLTPAPMTSAPCHTAISMKGKSLVSRVLAPVVGLVGLAAWNDAKAATVFLDKVSQHDNFGSDYFGVGVSGDKIFAAGEGGVDQFGLNLYDGIVSQNGAGSNTRDFGARDANSGYFVDDSTGTAFMQIYGGPGVEGLNQGGVLATTSSFSDGSYAFLMDDGTISHRDSNHAILNTVIVPQEIQNDVVQKLGLGAYENDNGTINYMIAGNNGGGLTFGRQFSTFGSSVLEIDANSYKYDGANSLTDVDFRRTEQDGLNAYFTNSTGFVGSVVETDFSQYALNSQIPEPQVLLLFLGSLMAGAAYSRRRQPMVPSGTREECL